MNDYRKLNMSFPVTCITGEVVKTYKAYLLTEHWKNIRVRYRASKLHKGCCLVCNAKDKPLELHHKSYKRLGKERLNDLIYLCHDCHGKTHEKYKYLPSNRTSLWNSHKKALRK